MRQPHGCSIRKDGRLELRFSVFNNRYSVYGRTYKECLAKKEKKLIEVYSGNSNLRSLIAPEYQDLRISELFEMWMLSRKGTIQDSTVYTNYRRWKNIFDRLGNKIVYRVKEADVIKTRDKMLEDGMSTTTINDVICQFNTIMNYALYNGMTNKNPCENILPLKRIEPEATDTNHRALTIEEQELFFKYAKESYYYNYYLFLLQTGLRCGEASALTWEDVDFENSIIHINKTWSRIGHREWILRNGLKTKAGKRDIPINDGIRKILISQLEIQAKNVYNDKLNLVFRSTTGDWVQRNSTNLSIKHILKIIAEEEGVIIPRFSNHAFRSTFATRAADGGMKPEVLKSILGHSKITTTMDLYYHALLDTKRDAMAQVKIDV